MKLNSYDRIVFTAATVFLGLLAVRPLFSAEPVRAQGHTASLYIEPGVHVINPPDNSTRVLGKIVIDLDTGDVWGFPTYADAPYPVNVEPGKTKYPTSTPIFLGRYDFSAMSKNQ